MKRMRVEDVGKRSTHAQKCRMKYGREEIILLSGTLFPCSYVICLSLLFFFPSLHHAQCWYFPCLHVQYLYLDQIPFETFE